MRKPGGGGIAAALLLLLLLALACPSVAGSRQRKGKTDLGGQRMVQVGMTLVPGAEAKGAVCLDGSPPAYHLDRGFGTGAGNWLLQFEGGGWCNDVASCLLRSATGHGSSRLMKKVEYFSGILSDDPSRNPGFYNWNRVKIRYCDGASFGGDSSYINGTMLLHFRGRRIWEAIMDDLLPKGLAIAQKALLSGCSAGGLATFLHCDDFRRLLPVSATVKCLSDAGFFLDVADIAGNYTMRSFFDSVVALQGVQPNLHANCTSSRRNPQQCFFPQHALPYIQTPYFILNAAYDVYQFHHNFVPPYADPRGLWNRCKQDLAACSPDQISVLDGYRNQMLVALRSSGDMGRGLYINSCFAHCQSELQDTWFASDSPRIHNKTIAETVGDWYFGRGNASEIDGAYPCNPTCHNATAQGLMRRPSKGWTSGFLATLQTSPNGFF